jgi:hypothetical protein
MAVGRESLQRQSLVVDDDGLFIPWPAIIEILHNNRPGVGRFRCLLMKVWGPFPQFRGVTDWLAG